ncbi:MAG: helicase-exonuclease AddAB subunit AddA [Lachnospiraceae bacterium]|nr:helicase-exonuclease AddAB subunit AddA [Lachnospiraceae bacterium]
MPITFTKTQQSVIDIRGKNILVAAAAGSGKTAVLVERIIKMVSDAENPVDIDRLLVLTFTNLAAGEMRERIGKALNKMLEKDAGNNHLQKQITLLHNAQITTIDSFCLFILRNHFHTIGLDPAYRVADEGELRLLKKEALAGLLEEWYESKNTGFLSCAEYFTTGINDSILEEYIEKLYDTAMSFPWPEEWLLERKTDYAIDSPGELTVEPWVKYLFDYTKNILASCVYELENALKICDEPDGPYMYSELIEKELQVLFNLMPNENQTNISELKVAVNSQVANFTDYQARFETIIFGRLPAKKDDSVSIDKREQVKNIRKLVKDTIKETGENYYRFAPDKIIEIMAKIHPAVSTLIDLTIDYKQRLDNAKRDKNIIDFGDMEHFALNILWEKTEAGLKPSAVARELKAHFVTVMTDEYQDSNQVQELLLQSISSEDEGGFNRFMVGDVKQSIYKFRLARPEIFMEKYDCYPNEEKEEIFYQRIDLNQNFRSRVNILTSVNYIFEKIMQKSLGGIEYDTEAALYPGADYPENGAENQTELLLLDLGSEAEADPLAGELLSDSKKELEARMIARRIHEIMAHFKVTDKKTGALRPVSYRDIVILLRTTKDWDEVFKKVLAEEGIPALTSARTGYFAASEIQTILQVISILDNPFQEIPLFGVMKSFFGGFSDEEIAIIKTTGQNREGLYDKLLHFAANKPENNSYLTEKITQFIHFIEINRKKAIYTPIADLLRELIVESGYYHYVAVRPDGEQQTANLEMLLKKAASFAQTSYYGLFHFVRYIEQLEKYEVDYGEANILNEQADVVRLMSIHKSKGLEFPICFVAGLHKRINMMDSRGALCLDADLGLGVDYIDPQLRVRRKSLRKNIISQKIKLDNLGEELRILYVAMTRAKEKLILSGVTEKISPRVNMDKNRPSFLKLAATGNFLDLLIPLIISEPAKDIFSTRIWSLNDLASATVNEIIDLNHRRDLLLAQLGENQIEIDNDLLSQDKVTQVSEKFARPYPNANLAGLYAKTTVSELKKASIITDVINAVGDSDDTFNQLLFAEPEVVPYIPDFMKEEALESAVSSGSARGSAYHKVMEVIKYKNIPLEAVKESEKRKEQLEEHLISQIDNACKTGRLPVEYKEAIPFQKIMNFFILRGPSGKILAERVIIADRAGKLFKEQPFIAGINANRINPELPAEETILMQGIIDVFFEEEDGLIILDYKSDAVKTKEELIIRYEKQLAYYQEALEQLTGKPVKEKIIYSFALNEAIQV